MLRLEPGQNLPSLAPSKTCTPFLKLAPFDCLKKENTNDKLVNFVWKLATKKENVPLI